MQMAMHVSGSVPASLPCSFNIAYKRTDLRHLNGFLTAGQLTHCLNESPTLCAIVYLEVPTRSTYLSVILVRMIREKASRFGRLVRPLELIIFQSYTRGNAINLSDRGIPGGCRGQTQRSEIIRVLRSA